MRTQSQELARLHKQLFSKGELGMNVKMKMSMKKIMVPLLVWVVMLLLGFTNPSPERHRIKLQLPDPIVPLDETRKLEVPKEVARTLPVVYNNYLFLSTTSRRDNGKTLSLGFVGAVFDLRSGNEQQTPPEKK